MKTVRGRILRTAEPRDISEQPAATWLVPAGKYEQRAQVYHYMCCCFLACGITRLYSNDKNMGLQQIICSFLNNYRSKNPAATESSRDSRADPVSA